MRRFTLILLAALVLLSVSGIAAQESTDAPDSSFQLVDSSPVAGEELGLNREITLYFSLPVDCESAQTAITIAPDISGAWTCSERDASATFTPIADYTPATTYTVSVAESLRAQDGTALGQAVMLDLPTTGNLIVSEVLPNDGTRNIEADAVITVIFNRPIVPLGIVEDADTLPQPLTISPAVEGQGEWLNTSIYMFRPETAFAGGTEYTVTVNAGLVASDGSVLREPFTWTFETIDPEITFINPENQTNDVLLDQRFEVGFNQPMNRESIEAGFTLRADATGEAVSGTFEWWEDDLGFYFEPDAPLTLDTLYTMTFDPAVVQSATGGAALTGETEFSFATVPYPSIINTDPFDGEQGIYPWGNFTIFFASPMNLETLEDKITIEPEPWREPDAYYSDYDNSYSLSFPAEPSTDYTVTISGGMEDVYGNVIEGDTVVEFTTTAYEPDVMLQVPGPVGFYNAYNDVTQLFLTHRNVSELDLSLYSLPLDEFVARSTGDFYYNPTESFVPARGSLLRQWQLDSDTALNESRYELLNLGEGGGDPAAACEGAPPSRLKVGDSAVVISDPDPVRARASAPDGEILTLMYRDYTLEITGGPECANGLLWWEVLLRDGQTAWVAEGDSAEYFLGVDVASATTPVVLNDPVGENALPPGMYALQVSAPETEQYGRSTHFLVVGTANLTLKVSIDSILVWATDVNSGEPIVAAPITIYGRDFEEIATGITDGDGLVDITIPPLQDLYAPMLAVLQTDDHFGVTLTQWSEGIEPYQFGQNFTSRPEQYRSYVYTDRPIYRPDQPVYFRGVVRNRDDVTYTPPDFNTVPVQILDESGEVVYEETLELTPFGTFSGEFAIAADAPLGYYRIIARMPGAAEDEFYYSDSGTVGFTVAEYRVPEFQVTLTPEQDEVVNGETIRVLVDSRYFFGGVVSGAGIEYRVVNEPYYFDYTGNGRYSFIDFNYDSGPGEFYSSGREEIASGTGEADAQGQFIIEVPADLEDATQSQTYTVEATVHDESGQSVSGRASVVVHKGLVYVGVSPEDYVATAGDETNVNLISVDWESNPVPDQTLEVQVVERRWSSVQEQDESGRTTWTWEVEEIPVDTGSVTTDADGRAVFTFVPPNGGIFKVIASTRDSEGNEVLASETLWVTSEEYVSWRQQNSNRIDLIANDDSYEVGDTAEILIASPFQGTTEALITVERGGVLRTEHVTMTNNSFVYELPITDEYAPNVYVSVLLVKGVDENNPVAAFRMGIIQLSVSTEQKELTIEITPDTEQAGPRETVNYTVRTTDFAGNPVQAEVGVGLTDLAALSIAPSNSSPILGFFYGAQGLSVRTATPLTINTDQLTQTTLDTIKGGGGGFGEGGIFDIREDFVDTAYWNATLTTDANGEATFSVTLPDNLTTWRLDARAVTSGEDGLTLVGQDTFDLLSTKPLLIRPVTPRFFVVGDVVTLAAVVNNNTASDQAVEVTLEGTGVTFQSDATQTFSIPAGARQRVEWNVTVDDSDGVDLTFYANGNQGEFTDASKPPLGQGEARLLPVLRYEVPETVGTAGMLREGGSVTEAIALPRRFDVTQGELTVSLEPSLAATTISALDYLRNYPYQCTEQTVSRFLPNIITFRALAELGIDNPELERNLDESVNFALQRLYAQQHVDGGWGWFVQDVSNPLTTAYALIGLTEARDQGFTVSDDTITRAQEYLQGTFTTPSLNLPDWRLNRQVFTLYAMARSGAPDAARTATMYEHRERLDYWAKAFLAMTLNISDPTDTSRVDTLLSDLMNAAIVSATGTHWEEDERDVWNWNTDTRTTAIVLKALVTLRPDSDLIPNVVRHLMVERRADAWETTQETAWSVMALTDWMVASGELQPAYTFSAALNGEPLADGIATPETVTESTDLVVQVSEMLVDQANDLVISRTEGNGALYYTAHLRAFLPVQEVEPLNRGIIIERRYTLNGDDSGTSITEANVGDVIQVRLTIIAPNNLHYVVIEDPIPAGTDAVNPDLAISQQIGTQPELNPDNPLSQGWGWWWFSNIEFRDEKVVLFSTYLPAGTYEYVYSIRAGLPGVFNVIPATGQEFYFPEVYGRSAGSTFTVRSGE